MIEKNISNEFQNNGVVLLKRIIDQKWIEELKRVLSIILKTQVNINVFMKKKIIKRYFMMIIVIGKE